MYTQSGWIMYFHGQFEMLEALEKSVFRTFKNTDEHNTENCIHCKFETS
jgi:hypothetical protein